MPCGGSVATGTIRTVLTMGRGHIGIAHRGNHRYAHGRIPNWLTGSVFVSGVAWSALTTGGAGLWMCSMC